MSNSISGGSDLAAELLLNKIMNGQIKTESGKTVTAGTRAKSSELNRQAIEPSIASANVKAGTAKALEIQTHLTEAKTYFENLDKALAGATLDTAKSLAKDAQTYIANLALREVDGVAVFNAGSTTDVSLGVGTESLALGGIALDTAFAVADTGLTASLAGILAATDDTTLATAVGKARTGLDDAIDVSNAGLGLTGMQVSTLEGRSVILDDIAATYTDAATKQSIVATGGASGLLNNVLN